MNAFTGPVPSDLYPPPPDKRADSLAIKQRIAELMSEKDGECYWRSLGNFLRGKIDRNEFQVETNRLLNSENLIGLHNSLVLSILHNSNLSSSTSDNVENSLNMSTSGEGWLKRKRAPPAPVPVKAKVKPEEKDPKRRKLKEIIMALSHRERTRLKQIATLKEKEAEQFRKQNSNQSKLPKSLSSSSILTRERTDDVMSTPLASKMKISSSTLYQDYMRCQQTPLCAEDKQLPDYDALKDRMSLIAYDCGLINGTESSAASLALIALEVHLKTILGDLLSLIRSDRTAVSQTECNRESSDSIVRTSAADRASVSQSPHFLPDSQCSYWSPRCSVNQPSSNLCLRDRKTQGLAPHLTARDFAAFSEISPHAFFRAHPGALERLISNQAFLEPNSSGDEEEEDEEVNLNGYSQASKDILRSRAHLGGNNWLDNSSTGLSNFSCVNRIVSHSSMKNQLGNRQSSSILSRTNSYSPRSLGKMAGRRLGKDGTASRSSSVFERLKSCGSPLNLNGQLSNSSRAEFGLSKVSSNGSRPEFHSLTNALRSDPHDNSCFSRSHSISYNFSKPNNLGPSLTHRNSINKMNGPVNGSGLDHCITNIERRSLSSANPKKSLAAELFPEEDEQFKRTGY
ncbi:transcriptional regulator of RNA polII, SAGA, subunit-domain-containing protein [Phakopsora pachyrhizi]|nr:transcriptional regulator of RNA polII, SAGA, subunit-domain-containing protein [Phakopsora pachyrhizi]